MGDELYETISKLKEELAVERTEHKHTRKDKLVLEKETRDISKALLHWVLILGVGFACFVGGMLLRGVI